MRCTRSQNSRISYTLKFLRAFTPFILLTFISFKRGLPKHCLAAIIAVFLFSLPLSAQQQERKLIDRLLKPDLSLKYTPRDGSGVVVKEFKTSAARTKPFFFNKYFAKKQFQTGNFKQPKWYRWRESGLLNKNAQMKVPVKKARFAKESPMQEKNFRTQQSYFEGKEVRRAELAYPEPKKIQLRGKSQGALDKVFPEKGPMTIDEIRELLNKNQ